MTEADGVIARPRSERRASGIWRFAPGERGRWARVQYLVERARAGLSRGQQSSAIPLLERALTQAQSLPVGVERNSLVAEALSTLGRCELPSEPPRALSRLSEIRELGRPAGELLSDIEARGRWDLQDGPEARELAAQVAEEARRSDRQLCWPHATLGKVALSQQEFDRAAHCLGHAQRLGADDPQVDFGYHYARAEMALTAGDAATARAESELSGAAAEALAVPTAWRARARLQASCARLLHDHPRPDIGPLELTDAARATLLTTVEVALDCLMTLSDQSLDGRARVAIAAGQLQLGRAAEARALLERKADGKAAPGHAYLLSLALFRTLEPDASVARKRELCERARTILLGDPERARPEAAALAGVLDLTLGNPAVAASQLERALQALGADGRPALREATSQQFGEALFALERYDQAEPHLHPDSRTGRLLQGLMLRLAGQHKQAAASLQAFCRTYPDDGDGWLEWGLALAEAGQPGPAHAALERAIALDRPAAFVARGHLALAAGDDATAAADYAAAAEAFPELVSVRCYQALALFRAGERTLAERALSGVAPPQGGFEAHVFHLMHGVLAEDAGALARAIGHYEQAVDIDRNGALAHSRLCHALLKAEQTEAALRAASDIASQTAGTGRLELADLEAPALAALGEAAVQQAAFALGQALWEAYLSGDPKRIGAQERARARQQLRTCQLRRIAAAIGSGHPADGLALADVTGRDRPRDPHLDVLRALSLLALGRAEEASSALAACLPDQVQGHLKTRVEALLRLATLVGRPEAERAEVDRAHAHGSDDLRMRATIAAVRGDLAQVSAAIDTLPASDPLLPFLNAALLGGPKDAGRSAGTSPTPPQLGGVDTSLHRALTHARDGDFRNAAEALGHASHGVAARAKATIVTQLAAGIVAGAMQRSDWPSAAKACLSAQALGVELPGARTVNAWGPAVEALMRGERDQAIRRLEQSLLDDPEDAQRLHGLLLAHLHSSDQEHTESVWRGRIAHAVALSHRKPFLFEFARVRAEATGMTEPTAEQVDALAVWLVEDLLIRPLEERERSADTLAQRQSWRALVLLAWREKLTAHALARLVAAGDSDDGPRRLVVAGPEYLARMGLLDRARELAAGATGTPMALSELAARQNFVATAGEWVALLLSEEWEAAVLYLLGDPVRARRRLFASDELAGAPGHAHVAFDLRIRHRDSVDNRDADERGPRGAADVVKVVDLARLPGPEPDPDVLAAADQLLVQHGFARHAATTPPGSRCDHYASLDATRALLRRVVPHTPEQPFPTCGAAPLGVRRSLTVAVTIDVASAGAEAGEAIVPTSDLATLQAYAAEQRAALRLLQKTLRSVAEDPAAVTQLRERIEALSLRATDKLDRAMHAVPDDGNVGSFLDAAIAILAVADETPGLTRVTGTLAEYHSVQAARLLSLEEESDPQQEQDKLDMAVQLAQQAVSLDQASPKYREILAVSSNRRGMLHLYRGFPHQALGDFNTSLSEKPDNSVVLSHRSDTHAALARWDEALNDLHEALRNARSQQEHEYALKRLTHYGRAAGVERTNNAMQRLEQRQTSRRDAQTELSKALEELHQAKRAIQTLGQDPAEIDGQIHTLQDLIRRLESY